MPVLNELCLSLLERVTAPEQSTLPLPETLLVFAHPDDEVIAVGARLGRFRQAHLIHVTDGAPRDGQDCRRHGLADLDAYRDARRQELATALRLAGVEGVSRECFGVPDQEAALNLPQVTERLLQRFRDREPEVVITHPYEGGHPDHDACAFTVAAAVDELRRDGRRAPLVVEAAFYHRGPAGIETGCFLESPGEGPEVICRLGEPERRRKRALLECFTTQRETLQYFGTDEERFRVAPRYDFSRPPADPPMFYESFLRSMNGRRFCELALEAAATETAGRA